MKKFTNLLIVASLALAGAVTAQEPTPEESKAPGKKTDKKAPAVKEPAAPKTEAPAKKEPAATKPQAPAAKEPAAAHTPAAPKLDKKAPKRETPAGPDVKPSGETPAAPVTTPAAKKEQPIKKDMKKAPVETSATATPAAADKTTASPATPKTTPVTSAAPKATATVAPATTTASATPATKATSTPAATTASATPAPTTASATPATTTASATPAAAATASVAPSVAATSPNPAAVKKPDPQKVEQIRQRHANFTAQPRPDRVPPVTFSASYRIQGSDQWQGPQYEVYRSYRPERHDQGYYRSRYQRVELIAGGYYYFHNNYWYPAWGYNPTNEYYAYDAPIYAGKRALPPDKVIAEVQAVLQEMGYYKGEVDGLLGPLTRAALTGYQTDNGMVVTAVIDEPTLDALGMG